MPEQRPLNILHLASSHRWTGAAEPATDLAQAQQALGHGVTLACIEGQSFWKRASTRGLDLVGGLEFKPGANVRSFQRDIRTLRRLVTERNIDVVHCHLTHDHWLAAGALRGFSEKSGGPTRPILVRTQHRDIVPRTDLLHRQLFRKETQLMIAVSRSGRKKMIERLGLEPDHVAWIHGAVDLDRFNPDVDRMINRTKWKMEPSTPVAGIVARMQAHRGHMALVEAAAPVLERVPDARFLISGRGEIREQIRQAIKAHPRRSHLLPVGYRKKDLVETYAAMDVSVLLAQGSDGTCRAMLEAMACGRPVIGVKLGAIKDTIRPNETGWLIGKPYGYKGLVDALVDALSNPERTREMGRAARRLMEAEYAQRHRAERTLEAYLSAIERYHGRQARK